MKTLKFAIVALISCVMLTLPSCGKDDEPDSSTSKSGKLIGTWKLVDCQIFDQFAEAGWISEDAILYLQFKSNGEYNTVSLQYDEVDKITNGTWSREGNDIKLYDDDLYYYGYTYKIVSLTSTKLVLEALTLQGEFKKVSDSEIEEYLE
ncbi:MAG: lipocalin family protein [Muribaculaceae bacterium]|nr:lipocalin family protein [Muribaculaceae bacterium]